MSRLSALCAALLLLGSASQALADSAGHAADAERFLLLARADKLAVPVYGQVREMFAQRFAESSGSQADRALLESYQAKADAALDKAVGWDKLKPEMVALYTRHFSEQEMRELITFYDSALGRKVVESMPQLTAQSAQLTQARLESAVPEVNQLLAEMSGKLQSQKP
jgi:uncharacterized protein